jgi:hypothetical protein
MDNEFDCENCPFYLGDEKYPKHESCPWEEKAKERKKSEERIRRGSWSPDMPLSL